jgi:hypothetical protein
MARPRIGIFGALVAVGGMLAWHWAQKHRASQARLVNDLNRWEEEGGAIAATTQTAPLAAAAKPSAHGTANGAQQIGSGPEAWHFPHG